MNKDSQNTVFGKFLRDIAFLVHENNKIKTNIIKCKQVIHKQSYFLFKLATVHNFT